MKGRVAIGLDAGRSAIKVVAYHEGKRTEVMYPTLAVPAVELTDPTTAARAKAETEIVDGKAYFTGDTARLQGNLTSSIGLNDNWTDTPAANDIKVMVFLFCFPHVKGRSTGVPC
ncbi:MULTISPECIES: hypothetical protein [Pseudomonas]|uniref:hypothetical protein n=1 Tax=Pseudomonas TaxID=286 RepID=UPI00217DE37A|nr:hypothetical protein [Pseudomonas sp. HD6515]